LAVTDLKISVYADFRDRGGILPVAHLLKTPFNEVDSLLAQVRLLAERSSIVLIAMGPI